MAEFYSIFVPMLFDIRFKVEYSDLEPSFFCFALFNLDIRALIFASTTNLEAGARFAKNIQTLNFYVQFLNTARNPD